MMVSNISFTSKQNVYCLFLSYFVMCVCFMERIKLLQKAAQLNNE